jgi:hypothetical protein
VSTPGASHCRKIATVLLIGICSVAWLAASCHTVRADDEIRLLDLREKPFQLHSKDDGWGELPCIATTSDFAYVAYGVREGYESHVYLARVPRGDGEAKIENIRIDQDGKIEFAPSITVDHRGGAWVAWSSFRDGEWAVRARYVMGMQPSPELLISTSKGFDSQVKVASRGGATWFVSTLWDGEVYRIVASTYEGSLGRSFTVCESANPVSRPDLYMLGRERALFVWDEYEGGRFTVKTREAAQGDLKPVEDLCGWDEAHNWEPHIAGSGDNVLVTWHRVPDGSDRCQPAAALTGGNTLEGGIDNPRDHETWRVRCFTDGDGATWIAWVSRFMYRSTRLYLRRITETGMSQTAKIEFPMQKNFINWFDCRCDDRLVLVWEYSGSVFLTEFGLPGLKGVGFPAVPSEVAGGDAGPCRQAPGKAEYAVDYRGERLKVYFGDDHNHTSFSDGRAYPDISMLLARDHRGLDFICVTDHDITLTPGEFAWNNTVADMLSEDDEYVCLHGYEPSKGWAQQGYGHWNMIFPGEGDVFQYEDGMTPEALQAYAIEHGALLIPHHVAQKFAPYDWDYFNPVAEPVVEMCSVHGIFESHAGNEDKPDKVEGKFIEDGLARGYRFGFIGGSDFHNCFTALYEEHGLTGVYAPSLTSESLFEAIRKRRTFALTGGRIVVDFRCNGHLMGEEIEGAARLKFTGYAASSDSVVSVEIISAKQAVFEQISRLPEVAFEWETRAPDSAAYYYLRALTANGDYAWSSPIWIEPSR